MHVTIACSKMSADEAPNLRARQVPTRPNELVYEKLSVTDLRAEIQNRGLSCKAEKKADLVRTYICELAIYVGRPVGLEWGPLQQSSIRFDALDAIQFFKPCMRTRLQMWLVPQNFEDD